MMTFIEPKDLMTRLQEQTTFLLGMAARGECDSFNGKLMEEAIDEIVRLKTSLKEMLDCYWGEGDGENPPEFIANAQRLIAGAEITER